MKRISDFFDETSKFVFVSSIVCMILAHGFCYMNLMYSHDSLEFYDTSGMWKIGLGRWLYPFLVQRRRMATPWLIGILSVIYVSLAVVLVVKILELDKIFGLCVAILFTTNITLTSLFCTYIFDADADCLALLLACFAVYVFFNYSKWIRFIIPAVALTGCLALYQAYVCVAIGLFMYRLIYESLKANTWKEILNIILLGIKELVAVILGVALYIPFMHILSKKYGIAMVIGYNGPGKLASMKMTDIFNSIPAAYEYFKEFFFRASQYNTTRINYSMLIILLIAVVIYCIAHRKFLGTLVIIVPGVLLIPLGLNAIYLVSFGTMHQLMIFAFTMIYILPIVFLSGDPEIRLRNGLLENFLIKVRNGAVAISFLAILYIGFHNIVYSNGAYVFKKLVYDNTLLHAQTIWEDINNIEGYDEGKTPVVFLGNFNSSKMAYNSSVGSGYLSVLTGATNSAITYRGTDTAFYYNILGRGMNIENDDTNIENDPIYMDMPVYPSSGYCKLIGDKVFVKVSK